MNNFIALILVINLLAIFINKGISIILTTLIIVLFVKMIKDRKYLNTLVVLLTFIIAIYNYKISIPYFYYGFENLNKATNMEYAKTVIGFIIMALTFSNKKFVENIYVNIKKFKTLVFIEVSIAQFVILYMLILGKGWLNLWGLNDFVGRYATPHPYGYSLIIMAIVIEWLIIEFKNKSLMILYVIPLCTSFLTGARTPLIGMLLIFFAIRYLKEEVKFKKVIDMKKRLILVVTTFGLLATSPFIFAFVLKSNIMKKFIETQASGNISNSRFEFWGNLLNAFNNQFGTNEKLFGHGINYTMIINNATIRSPIWGHSDFIDILISYGVIMLIIFVIVYMMYFYRLRTLGASKSMSLLLFTAFVFLSTTNGTVNYSLFTTSICYLSIYCKSVSDNINNNVAQ